MKRRNVYEALRLRSVNEIEVVFSNSFVSVTFPREEWEEFNTPLLMDFAVHVH